MRVPASDRALIDKTSKAHIRMSQDGFDLLADPQTLGQVIRSRAETQPHHSAIVAAGFAALSYRHLCDEIAGIRSQLRQTGLGPRSRVGIALPDDPEAVLAIVAISCSAIAVPIDPKLAATEIEQRLGILHLDALIVLQGSESAARTVASRHGLRIIEALPAAEGKLGLRLDARASSSSVSFEEPGPDSVAFILQASGTVALPKLIPISHRNMLAAGERLQAWFKLTPLDRS